MGFEIDISGNGFKQIDIGTRQIFDDVDNIKNTKFTKSFLFSSFDESTGVLHIQKMRSFQEGKHLGREMISNAIEAVGPDRIKVIRAELADTNKAAFDLSFKANSNAVEAVRNTPLGKALRDLGFNKIEAMNAVPFPKVQFFVE